MKNPVVWKRYLIAVFIGASVSLLILLTRGSFAKDIYSERYKDFSDAFFVPGALLASFGALIFVAQNGVFDMIKFGVLKVVSMMRSEKHRADYPRNYNEYLKNQAAKSRAAYGYLLFTGAVFLALSAIFAFV
mgnify:CR=1 FL=1